MSRGKLLQILTLYVSGLHIFTAVGAVGFALLAPHSYVQTGTREENAIAQSGRKLDEARYAASDSIRPFRVNIPQAALDYLRERVLATRCSRILTGGTL